MFKCPYDPTEYKDEPIGMYHCPECGQMVLAGMPHPNYQDLEQGDNNGENKTNS